VGEGGGEVQSNRRGSEMSSEGVVAQVQLHMHTHTQIMEIVAQLPVCQTESYTF